MQPPFQIGLVVEHLETAMEELGAALQLTWAEPQLRRLGPWTNRVTFCRPGPPFIELIEGQPGSPWDPAGGYRLDHIGYWTADVGAESARLAHAGMPVEVDGAQYSGPWTYHRGERTGLRVELVDLSRRAGLYETYGLTDRPPRDPSAA